MPAGKFRLTTKSGAEITFTLPTPASAPELSRVESYRMKTGGAPVSYLVADVDNRNGNDSLNMYRVSAFDKEGRKYTFMNVSDFFDQWSPKYGEDGKYRNEAGQVLDDATARALGNESADFNNNVNVHFVQIAERATFVLACKDVDLPSAYTRVAVEPKGMGPGEEAQPTA